MTPFSTDRPTLASIENAILSIWREVLGAERFGVHDRPFEAGATSLSLIRVHHQLERRLTVSITPMALFEHPTVADLARQGERI
jgi:hypothetical protein